MSLAEMASMAPISGGQYHWVSEFAPPKYQKFLSYFTGRLHSPESNLSPCADTEYRMDVDSCMASWCCLRILPDRHDHPRPDRVEQSGLRSYELAGHSLRVCHGLRPLPCQRLCFKRDANGTEFPARSTHLCLLRCHHRAMGHDAKVVGFKGNSITTNIDSNHETDEHKAQRRGSHIGEEFLLVIAY